MDRFVKMLLITGRGAVEAVGRASAMLVGAKGEEERVSILLSSRGQDAETRIVRYTQAIMLCLFAGAECIYELRDVFIAYGKDETAPPPRADPEALNALQVSSLSVETLEEEVFVQHYSIGDKGEAIFHKDVHRRQGTETGLYPDTCRDVIKHWKEAGSVVVTLEEVEAMRRNIGFLGRVGGDDSQA